MRKFLWLEIACVLCFFSGCKSTHNYPGYTAVGSDGAGRSYYIDLESLQSRFGLVQLSLLTEYQGKDYAIFSVTTNCHGMLKRLAGTRYRADGSILGDSAGDTDPLQIMDKAPELSPAVTMACKRASEIRYFAGHFDPSKALELLFGNYNRANRASTWSDVQRRVSSFQGTEGIVSLYFDSDYSDHGTAKHVLLTSTVPDSEYTCHGCSPVVSAFVFANRDGKWFPESEQYDVDVSSSWGKPPSAKLVTIGPDAHGIVLSVGDMAQGISSAWDAILVPSSAGLHVALQLTTEDDNAGTCGEELPGNPPCYQTHATYEFVPGKNGAFYDLVVTESGTRPSASGQVVSATGSKRYSYVSGKYEPIT